MFALLQLGGRLPKHRSDTAGGQRCEQRQHCEFPAQYRPYQRCHRDEAPHRSTAGDGAAVEIRRHVAGMQGALHKLMRNLYARAPQPACGDGRPSLDVSDRCSTTRRGRGSRTVRLRRQRCVRRPVCLLRPRDDLHFAADQRAGRCVAIFSRLHAGSSDPRNIHSKKAPGRAAPAQRGRTRLTIERPCAVSNMRAIGRRRHARDVRHAIARFRAGLSARVRKSRRRLCKTYRNA